MIAVEKYNTSYVPKRAFAGILRLSFGIGLVAGFLRFYQRPTCTKKNSLHTTHLHIHESYSWTTKVEFNCNLYTYTNSIILPWISALPRLVRERPWSRDGHEGDGWKSQAWGISLWRKYLDSIHAGSCCQELEILRHKVARHALV